MLELLRRWRGTEFSVEVLLGGVNLRLCLGLLSLLGGDCSPVSSPKLVVGCSLPRFIPATGVTGSTSHGVTGGKKLVLTWVRSTVSISIFADF